MKKKYTVTIGVPAFNEEASIARMLISVLKQKERGYKIEKIIVVSDGSTDNTVRNAKAVKDIRIKVIADNTNKGRISRLNQLIGMTETDILIFLDADEVLEDRLSLSKLLSEFAKDEKVVLVGGNPRSVGDGKFVSRAQEVTRDAYHKIRYRIKYGHNIYGCMGGMLAMSKEFYRNLKIPSDIYADDSYMYLTCITRGYKFRNAKGAKITHYFPTSLRSHIRRNKRHDRTKDDLKKYYGDLVDKEFHISRKIFFTEVFKQFVKHPIPALSIYFINSYIKLRRKFRKAIPLLLLSVLSIFFVFFKLGKQSYGVDESFSLYVSRSLPDMTHILWYEEANMWLYYLTLHFWQMLGNSEFIVRSLSAIFALASIGVIYKIAKQLFDKTIANIAVLLTIINIFFIFHAQIARSYSLLLLLVCLSSYFFLQHDKGKKYKVLYILTSILSFYAHFFTGFVILSHFISSILQGKLKQYLVDFITISILTIPALIAPSFHSNQVDWITKPNLFELAVTGFMLAGDLPFLYIIYGLIFLSLVPFLLKNYSDYRFSFLLGWLGIPVIVAFIFSIIIKPIYQSDYFIFVLPPFVMLGALAISRINKEYIKRILLILLVLFSMFRLWLWYSEDMKYNRIIVDKETDWRSAANYVMHNSSEDEIVIFYGYYGKSPYSLYNSNNPAIVEIASSDYSLGGGERLPEPNIALIENFSYYKIWLILDKNSLNAFDGQEQYRQILNALSLRYRLVEINHFSGIDVISFYRN